MKITSIQSMAGGTGVTYLGAEIALAAAEEGRNVVALDLSPNSNLYSLLAEELFHYIDDVRLLFAPSGPPYSSSKKLPVMGLFAYPNNAMDYITRGASGALEMAYEPRVENDAQALAKFREACSDLASFYDEMIIDVPAKNWKLMDAIADVSDELHLMLRDCPSGVGSIADWRQKIDRPEGSKPEPIIITHADMARAIAA